MQSKQLILLFACLWTLLVAVAAGVATNWTERPGTGADILAWGGVYALGFIAMVALRKRWSKGSEPH